MRVLVATPEAFGAKGGIAQYNRDFLHALCGHPRCEEVVAVPRRAEGTLEVLPQNLDYRIPRGSRFGFLASVLRAVVSANRFDLVVCGHINLLPVAYLASRLSRAPLVLMIYGIDVWQPHRSRLVRRLVKRVRAVISISDFTLQKFIGWSGYSSEHCRVLPNAIELERYRPGPKAPDLVAQYGLEGKQVLMTVGRMSADERYKGFDEVINVLPEVRTVFPDAVYLIVGDGTDKARLEAKVRERGLDNVVRFAGFVPEDRKVEHYRLADAYVMPSYGEGFGFVFLEAMACGVPVVASRADGGREAVRGGALGLVVDPRNPDELVEAIVKALRRSKGVVPEGLDYFEFPSFQRRLHGMVDQLIDEKDAPL